MSAGGGFLFGGLCRVGLCVYRASLRLLPRRFRGRYGAAMIEAVRSRLNGAWREGRRVGVLFLLTAEVLDVVRTSWTLRPSVSVRPGWAFPALLAIVAAVAFSDLGTGTATLEAYDFNARDPAGEFTLTILGDRAVAASVDGVSVPARDIRHVGDSIHIDALSTRQPVTVWFDPSNRRIQWVPRNSGA